jgi:hypothetical protein
MPMMPHIIYILCVLTCLGCAFLLYRAYWRSRLRLLLWSSIFFLILGLSNVLLFVDLVVYSDMNLLPWRSAVTLGAILVLLAGLIFESD